MYRLHLGPMSASFPLTLYHYYFVIAHWFAVLANGFFMKFDGNKPLQISRTFRSILTVYNIALFWSSTSRIFIPNCSNLFRSFFGIAPIATITIGVIFTFIFHIFFNYLCRTWYFSIFCYYNSHNTQLTKVEGVSACYGLPASRQVRPQQTS